MYTEICLSKRRLNIASNFVTFFFGGGGGIHIIFYFPHPDVSCYIKYILHMNKMNKRRKEKSNEREL